MGLCPRRGNRDGTGGADQRSGAMIMGRRRGARGVDHEVKQPGRVPPTGRAYRARCCCGGHCPSARSWRAPPDASSSAALVALRHPQAGRCIGTTPSSSLRPAPTTPRSRSARLRWNERLAKAEQRESGSGGLLGCLQRHAHCSLGFAGNSTFRSPPGSYVAEWWFFSTALSAADRDELYADEKALFGLP